MDVVTVSSSFKSFSRPSNSLPPTFDCGLCAMEESVRNVVEREVKMTAVVWYTNFREISSGFQQLTKTGSLCIQNAITIKTILGVYYPR